MLRPAFLFSTAVLAAITSIQEMPGPDRFPAALPQPSALTTPRLSAPTQTISQEVSKPVQPQRWVF